MANRQKNVSKPKARKTVDYWKSHDNYRSNRLGFENVLTRSQTAFSRVNNDDSDLNLYCDRLMHEPLEKMHILETLKGKYGGIPRTIITRSTLQHLEVTKGLCKRVDEYKDKNLRKEHLQDLKEFHQEQIVKQEDQLPKVDDRKPTLDDEIQMDDSKDPDIRKKVIEELKEYQQEHMTKTPAHDEKPPKTDDGPIVKKEAAETSTQDKKPKADDEPMDETVALQVQEERKEKKMEAEEKKPLTKEEWIKKYNDASDYYADSKDSVKPAE